MHAHLTGFTHHPTAHLCPDFVCDNMLVDLFQTYMNSLTLPGLLQTDSLEVMFGQTISGGLRVADGGVSVFTGGMLIPEDGFKLFSRCVCVCVCCVVYAGT